MPCLPGCAVVGYRDTQYVLDTRRFPKPFCRRTQKRKRVFVVLKMVLMSQCHTCAGLIRRELGQLILS